MVIYTYKKRRELCLPLNRGLWTAYYKSTSKSSRLQGILPVAAGGRDIHFSVSAIACHLCSVENCPDFLFQIAECLTLFVYMSAIVVLSNPDCSCKYRNFLSNIVVRRL